MSLSADWAILVLMVGHSSVTTTQVYARIVDRMTENSARFLEALLA